MAYKTNPWIIFLTIVLTAVVIGGGFLLWQNQAVDTDEAITDEAVTDEEPGIAKTKKTYTSETYALSFEYPDDWTVSEDVVQLDVQPPPPAQWSNYFTIAILDREYSPYENLEERVAARNLEKADFTIDGKEVYMNNLDSLDESTLVYLLFSHQDKVYQLHLFNTWYDMPEVQAMIESLQLL